PSLRAQPCLRADATIRPDGRLRSCAATSMLPSSSMQHYEGRLQIRAVVKVLTRAINEVPRPEVQAEVSKLGETRGSTPEAMTERMKSDIAKWAAVIEKAGIPKYD